MRLISGFLAVGWLAFLMLALAKKRLLARFI